MPLHEGEIGSVVDVIRWQEFLEAASRTSVEFNTAWADLQTEARQCSLYLEKELESPLCRDTALVGSEVMSGSVRNSAVHQRESLRHQVLEKSLAEHPDRDARPVTAYPNFDKTSGA